jgi:hypothetical protein
MTSAMNEIDLPYHTSPHCGCSYPWVGSLYPLKMAGTELAGFPEQVVPSKVGL